MSFRMLQLFIFLSLFPLVCQFLWERDSFILFISSISTVPGTKELSKSRGCWMPGWLNGGHLGRQQIHGGWGLPRVLGATVFLCNDNQKRRVGLVPGHETKANVPQCLLFPLGFSPPEGIPSCLEGARIPNPQALWTEHTSCVASGPSLNIYFSVD